MLLMNRCASTFYVDATSGSDANNGQSAPWQTIAKVNATSLPAGATVLFKRGETWTLTEPLLAKSGIAYADYGSGDKPILDGNDACDCIDCQSNTTLRNLDLRQGLDFGIECYNVSDVTITDCEVSDCGNDNVNISAGSHDITVTRLTSFNPYRRTVGPSISCFEIFGGAHDITVDTLICYGSPDSGIAIHAHTGESMPYNITIRNATSYSNTVNGANIILIDAATDAAVPSIVFDACTFRDNTVKGFNVSKAGTATGYPSGVTLQNSRIYGNTASGVYPLEVHGANHVIKNNLVVGETERGATFADVTNLTCYNNTFHVKAGTTFQLVMVFQSTNNGILFKNNIISTASTQVILMKTTAAGAGTGLVCDYNLYYTPSGAAANRWSWAGGANTTFANWKTQSSQDAHSPAPADPLYVDTSTVDYTLQALSPAINAGVDVGLTYLGVAPDCGAYEKA